MATIQIQLSRKTIIIGLAFVALAGASCFGGAKLAGHVGTSAPITVEPSAASHTPHYQPQQSPLQGAGSPWEALQPLSESWISHALSAKLLTSTAVTTSLSSEKPVLITAYWCGFCHEELQLLAQNHLLNKLQVVGVSFEGHEAGQKPATITNVQQAAAANWIFVGARVIRQAIHICRRVALRAGKRSSQAIAFGDFDAHTSMLCNCDWCYGQPHTLREAIYRCPRTFKQ